MWGNIIVVLSLFASNVSANADASVKKKPGFIRSLKHGDWKKHKRISVKQNVEIADIPIDPAPSEYDIISWLEIHAKSYPFGDTAIEAKNNIASFIKNKPFPLSLTKRIQKAFGKYSHTPFTKMLTIVFNEELDKFIRHSPCAYEKVLYLSNHKKLNLGATTAIVDYLRTAPKEERCTSLLTKRLEELHLTYFKTPTKQLDIPSKNKEEVLAMSTDEILKILQKPTLYISYPPTDVQFFAMRILDSGSNEEIFELMSLNLATHEMISGFFDFIPLSYLQRAEQTFGSYRGNVAPFLDHPSVTALDNAYQYGPQLKALRNHNWRLLDSNSFQLIGRARRHNIDLGNEGWKWFYYQRKMEKEMGMITFHTLEDDYNSISMGTATSKVVEAFCKNIDTISNEEAQFWNLKFRRYVMVKDAILGACPKNKSDLDFAMYMLRIAAHTNDKPDCSTVDLLKRLPEFAWFVSLVNLGPLPFEHLFKCGFKLEDLLEMNNFTYILEKRHFSLAEAINSYASFADEKEQIRFSDPLISNFLKISQF